MSVLATTASRYILQRQVDQMHRRAHDGTSEY
jgi:hypothetical protein